MYRPWISKTPLLALIYLLTLASISGCSKEGIKSTEEDLIRIRRISTLISDIKNGYEAKDLTAILSLLDPPDSDYIADLKRRLEADFDNYSSMQLSLYIDMITIERDNAAVSLHWEGDWEKRSDKARIKEKGNTTFRIKGEAEMKLSSIDGDNPFGISFSKGFPPKEREGR